MTRLSAIALLGLAVAGCGGEVSATVNCKVTPSAAVECEVQQTQGTAELEVCWKFHVTCASGATLDTEHSCARVKDGNSVTVTAPDDELTIKGNCEGEMTAEVRDLSWKAK